MTVFLDLDDLVSICQSEFGSFPIRDVGLLDSALARARATAFGDDAYADDWRKAAALLESLVVNHALVDGNKRLTWLATKTFLRLNGHDATTSDADLAYDLVIDIASGTTHEIGDLAARLSNVLTDS